MAKLTDKGKVRSAKQAQILATQRAKESSMRVVQAPPVVGSFSRAQIKAAIFAAMLRDQKG